MTKLLGHHPWTQILARGSHLVCPPGCVSCRQENDALPAPSSLTPQLPCTHRSASSGLCSPPDGDPSSVAFPAVLCADAPVRPAQPTAHPWRARLLLLSSLQCLPGSQTTTPPSGFASTVTSPQTATPARNTNPPSHPPIVLPQNHSHPLGARPAERLTRSTLTLPPPPP